MNEGIFKAMSDSTRRKIIELLKEGPKTAGDIANHCGRSCLKHRIDALSSNYNWHYVYVYSKHVTPCSTKLVGRIPHSMDYIEYGKLESYASIRGTTGYSSGNSHNYFSLDFTNKLDDEVGYSRTDTPMAAHYSCGFVFLR